MRRYLAVVGLAVLVGCGGTSAPASTATSAEDSAPSTTRAPVPSTVNPAPGSKAQAVCATWAKLNDDVNSRRVTDGLTIYQRLIDLSRAATSAAQSNPAAAALADAASTMMQDYRSGTPAQLAGDRAAMNAQCATITP